MSEHRILFIENPAHLSIELGRLKIDRSEFDPTHIALADVAVLVLHHHSITLTHSVLNQLAEAGAVIISTNQKHMPCAMQLPLIGNVQLVSRLEAQIAMRESELPGELWRQLIVCRLKGQAKLLDDAGSSGVAFLKRLADKVKPGDPGNLESQGARHFWQNWLPDPHKRTKQGAEDHINAHLNFGYAILRSCIARVIVGAGLNPALGIHHKNAENLHNLADDIMEPYRYLVEKQIAENLPGQELNSEGKKRLATVVSKTVTMSGGKEHRFTSAIQETVSSLVRVMDKRQNKLELPDFEFH